MLENYSFAQLESAYSAASDKADRASKRGDVQTVHEALDFRQRVQAEINLRAAQHNLFSAQTLEQLDCARSELREAEAEIKTLRCTGSAFEAASAGLQKVRAL